MKVWIWVLIIVVVAVAAFIIARKTAPCCRKKPSATPEVVKRNTPQVPGDGGGINFEETKIATDQKVAEKFQQQVGV